MESWHSSVPPPPPPPLCRVLVVDDHRTFTDLVALALAAEDDLEYVGAAHDAAQARAMVRDHHPDVVIMDVNLGNDDGLDLSTELILGRPDLRVVVLTAHADASVMRRAAAAGACALQPKDGSLPELLDALRTSRPGGFVVHPALLHRLVTEPAETTSGSVDGPTLSPREHDVLQLLAVGRDTRQIARELGISVNTCRGYVQGVLSKLGAHSQLEAVVVAGLRGLIDANAPR